MHYNKRFIQFNDLVFGGANDITLSSYVASTKLYNTPYSFRHGDYLPFKSTHATFASSSVTLHLVFDMKEIDCGSREYFVQFVHTELAKHGRLWAIQNNTLIWAWATLSNYSEDVFVPTSRYTVDVSLLLPEGVWHIANNYRTFLKPYAMCDVLECYDYHNTRTCADDCCTCHEETRICNCDCECAEKEDALCYFKDVNSLYDPCGAGFRILYSCESAKKHFGNLLEDHYYMGQRICNGGCNDIEIAGQLYSQTALPTDKIKILVKAQSMHDIAITINDNTNVIKGDYEDFLEIKTDGTVFNHANGCYCDTPLDVDKWVIPEGMDYGWSVHQGNNRFIIDIGSCCQACAWVEVDELSF